MIRNLSILPFLGLLLWCCTPDSESSVNLNNEEFLFELLDTAHSNVTFINRVQDQEDFNVLTYRNYYNGGGVAIGDINNDGRSDLYFTSNMETNRLYLNQGDMVFKDITEIANVGGNMAWSTGVTFVDINGDGWLDIYVCNSGDVNGALKRNELFINNGDLSFTESAEAYGLDDAGFSTHASFFDIEGDGDLDMYLLNNSFKDPSRIDFKNIRNERDSIGGDKLFLNNGGAFTDISEVANIYGSKIGFGLGVSVSDINQDNLPDIYISNDFWERDYLYINQGKGKFKEELTERIPVTSTASMGADISDIDNNGSFDIFSTDMLPASSFRLKRMTIFNDYKLEDLKYRNDYHYQHTQNCLQLNDGYGHFVEIANQLGLAATDWSWAALIFDFDNDGLKDIFVSNGVYHDITDMDFSDFIDDDERVKEIVEEKGRFDFRDFLQLLPSNALPNYAFANRGSLKFVNQAKNLGLGMPSFSNGSAYGDLDNDGDLDLVVNNVNMPAFVYENTGGENNYLRLKFEGDKKNVFGIGAKVEIICGKDHYYSQNYQARGFQSSTEPILTCGVGQHNMIDSLIVIWPSHRMSVLTNIEVNRETLVKEVDAQHAFVPRTDDNEGLLTPLLLTDSTIVHKENLYNDFDRESLALHMFSSIGPKILTGDLNGDDREDMVVLGAADHSDQVLLQNDQGNFSLVHQASLERDKGFESSCGVLMDIDHDGDDDLILANGGNESGRGIAYYKVRSYLNDGKGVFQENRSIVLPIAGNISAIEALDIGGKPSLYAVASIVPGNYGLLPRNFLLQEHSVGVWKDITDQSNGQMGMVQDVVLTDIDGDNDQDVVVVGEWMGITLLENNGKTLVNRGVVDGSNGLWQSVTTGDVDNDGDMDLIIGNWGNNSKLQASEDRPLSMYVGDFDENKKSDILLLWYAPEDDEPSLFAAKRDLIAQLPHLKKKILKNIDYAQAELKDLIESDQLKKGLFRTVDNLNSSVLINQGDFRFDLRPLPAEAQRSTVHAIEVVDLNQDGYKDLIIGGNMYGLKPEIGRMDSSDGTVLVNDGKGNFTATSSWDSGFDSSGEIRDIKYIRRSGLSNIIVVGINNESIEFYEINE